MNSAAPVESLLLTLEEISQLVSHSHDPGETLMNIVSLIQARFQTAVCSVYLLEPQRGELVLGATVGLRRENVGRVRMKVTEGLTGLVAERMAPVMVDDAFQHPRFKYFPELGEDRYHSFLGVPLIEGGSVQGVLVVQTAEPRSFTSNEIRMLVTVGSQLAPLISEARVLEQVVAAAHEAPADTSPAPEPAEPTSLRCTPLSPGIGVGQAYSVNGFEDWQPTLETRQGDFATEKQRLGLALHAARDEIARLSQRISTLVGEDHGAVLQAQLMIMQDRTVEQDLTTCLKAGSSAEGALIQTLDKYVAAFQKLTTAFFQERVYDVKDVFRRILWHLQPDSRSAETSGGRVVLLAREASVMDLFSVDLERLAAVIVEHGGAQSHAAILARSLGVPMVSQVPEFVVHLQPGRQLLVNATVGMIYLDPADELIAALTEKGASGRVACFRGPAIPEVIQPIQGRESMPPGAPAPETRPRVEANINLLCEVGPAVEQRVSGVGLYRSEFLFLARRTLPTEDEQVGIYRKLLGALGGRPVSIRTFDLRPDKLAHVSHLTTSVSAPLDWRLVLDSPPVQKLFKEQVRAILRAGTSGSARILVPLVTRTEQLDFVIETVSQAREELRREGLEFANNVPLGVMIEVAAAVFLIDRWARQVDFFSLGTNDLIASAFGTDRDDPVGANRDDALNPGILRMIQWLLASARLAGRQVTVCGEMAADPQGALALAALGVDALSVPVSDIQPVRQALAEQTDQNLADLAAGLTELRTAGQARDFLRGWSRRSGLPA